METQITEISDLESSPSLGKTEEAKKIDIQIFQIEELKKCLDFIRDSCILPVIRKSDFETMEKTMLCYRTILLSFETLAIGQEVIVTLKS